MQAYKQNYIYPRYVFMTYDWFPPKWWTFERSHDVVHVNCTDEELANFIERSLSFQWRPVPDNENVLTDTGKVSNMLKFLPKLALAHSSLRNNFVDFV